MLCARVINGIGTGFLNVIVPVWSAEVRFDFRLSAALASMNNPLTFDAVLWLRYTDSLSVRLPQGCQPHIARSVTSCLEAHEKWTKELIRFNAQCVW